MIYYIKKARANPVQPAPQRLRRRRRERVRPVAHELPGANPFLRRQLRNAPPLCRDCGHLLKLHALTQFSFMSYVNRAGGHSLMTTCMRDTSFRRDFTGTRRQTLYHVEAGDRFALASPKEN